jgi:glycosyltransferase involved in cell wall biosynthesis
MSLVRNLPESGHSIDLFGPELDRYTYSSGLDSVSYTGLSVSDSLLAERLWHFGAFSAFARRQKYDAVLFPAGVKFMPLHFDVRSVVVVQTILSDMYQKSDDGLLAGLLKVQLKKAHRIIAASRFIRDDLINLRIPESKITVIHNGIDTNLFYPRQMSLGETVLIHPFSIRRPYIIYASRVAYPSKCHIELLRAFSIFKQKTGLPHRLVLAGADGVNAEIVHREIIKSPYASDILLTGYFPHQNLPELYSAADACIFPSSIEGVGLPVLEAMACGIPVACARAGALPEMAGDSVVYFDQNSPDEIASAIERLVHLPDGSNDAMRADLSARGIEWVKNFDWKKCAASTLETLESLEK